MTGNLHVASADNIGTLSSHDDPADEIGVTNHAVLRWMERVMGIDLGRLSGERDADLLERLAAARRIDVARVRATISGAAENGRRRITSLYRPAKGEIGPGPVREWRVDADVAAIPVVVDREGRRYVPTILFQEMTTGRRMSTTSEDDPDVHDVQPTEDAT